MLRRALSCLDEPEQKDGPDCRVRPVGRLPQRGDHRDGNMVLHKEMKKKTIAMKKTASTEIVVVLDRSGSMAVVRKDMEGGFDHLIEEQKKAPGKCRVTLAQFDDQYELVYSGVPVGKVPKLHLYPRGYTALLDALGKTINETETRLSSIKEKPQVLFVVITDGAENASKEFTGEQVFDMIKHKRDKSHWEFVFLGANQDAIKTATNLGISATNSITFHPNSVGTQSVYQTVSRGIVKYRGAGIAQMNNIANQAEYNITVQGKTT